MVLCVGGDENCGGEMREVRRVMEGGFKQCCER